MIIHDDQWHYQLYLWSRRAWFRFWHREDLFEQEMRDTSEHVNLCPYMRTLGLYLPFIVLTHAAVVAVLAYVLFWMPTTLAPHVSLGFTWAGFLATVIRVIGVLVAVMPVIAFIAGVVWLWWRIPRKPRKGPSIFAVMAAYVEAAHDAVCPRIPIKHGRS